MTLVVVDLGWVDFYVSHSTVTVALLGQTGIWQSAEQLGKMDSTQVRDHQGHPVLHLDGRHNL